MSRVLVHRAQVDAPSMLDALVADTVEAVAARLATEMAERIADPGRMAALVDQVVQAAAQRVATRAMEIAEQLAGVRQTAGMTIALAARVSGMGQGELRRLCASPATSPRHLRHVKIGRKIVIRRAELDRWMQAAEQ